MPQRAKFDINSSPMNDSRGNGNPVPTTGGRYTTGLPIPASSKSLHKSCSSASLSSHSQRSGNLNVPATGRHTTGLPRPASARSLHKSRSSASLSSANRLATNSPAVVPAEGDITLVVPRVSPSFTDGQRVSTIAHPYQEPDAYFTGNGGFSVGNGGHFGYDNPMYLPGSELILTPSGLGGRGMEDGEVGEEEAFADEMVVIERPIYSQKDFDQGFEGGVRPKRNARTWLKAKARKCECSCSCLRRFLTLHLPFLGILRDYSLRRDLVADVIAGLTVGIMHIPQGMAYGQLSTLPPVFGLYVSFFPVILYFFLGTSKHVSIGTFAVVSLMVGSAVDKGMKDLGLTPISHNVTVTEGNETSFLITDNSEEILDAKLKLAMAVTFAVGVLQLLLGLLQLGFLTVYLSDPLISGFTTGAACHVFTSQIKHIFGISMGRYSGAFKLIFSYRDIFKNLPDTNAVTFIASLVCMVLLFVTKEYINNNPKIKPKLKMPVPVELIVVVLGTVISHFVKLEETYEVKIVGDIPVGIPEPNLKAFAFLSRVVSDAIAIAIVAFAISVSMAKIFAKKHEYEVDSNQELLAYGLCNIFSSFFSSFVSAVSLSRSLVQENVGGRTQVTGLVSSALLLVVLLVVGPYFKTLPNCILASIILVALKGMFKQFAELKRLWNISVIDFAVWLVTFSATVLLDVDLGLLVGVVFALLTVIMRSQRPYSCLLGQVPGTDIYKDISVYKAAEETPNVKIFRFDSALFFANSEFFKSSLYKLAVDPNDLKRKQRKLNKKKKKEEKELLNITVDSLGSTKIQDGEHVALHPHAADDNTDGTPNAASLHPPPTQAATAAAAAAPPIANGTDEHPNIVTELPTLTDVHYIILDCSTMSYVDSVGVKVLQQVIAEFRAFNITVYLAQCKSGVREMFERTNFYKTGNKNFLFITIHDAVVSAQLHQWSILGEHQVPSNSNNNQSASGPGEDLPEEQDGNEERGQEEGDSHDVNKPGSNGDVDPLRRRDNEDHEREKDSTVADVERTEV
ncbi:prestin isoform X2 [Aplysia californica]|uniref:Prestin isoform X2 n=1 Tax=Aplysia californica TaxID=6500 RepID=A0ABM0ZW40_APLCA|nr:prestin isoform X2 [Aplysia californica]